jgi:hypothetical protein
MPDRRGSRGAEARVLRITRAQAILGRRLPELDPVRELFGELTDLPQVSTHLAELTTGVSTRYDPKIPGEHPWLGRLAPNLKPAMGERHTGVAELHGLKINPRMEPPNAAATLSCGFAVDMRGSHRSSR